MRPIPPTVKTDDIKEAIRARLSDPWDIIEALGLTKGAKKQPFGFRIRCPWHDDHDPSCSVQFRQGVLLANCFSCKQGGDVFDLIAQVNGLDPTREFNKILLAAAKIANAWDIVQSLQNYSDSKNTQRFVRIPQRNKKPIHIEPPSYPPQNELDHLIQSCARVNVDSGVADWLLSRSLSPDSIAIRSLALALPLGAPELPPWASFGAKPWTSSAFRCIIPLVDASGFTRSVRARCVDPNSSKSTPKAVPPKGFSVKGLVMADPIAIEVLRSSAWPSWHPDKPHFVITEGEPDFLTWASRAPSDITPLRWATFGIVQGSWTPEIAARIPSGARVTIRTDNDLAGNKYAATIASTLAHRCDIRRSHDQA